MGMLEVLVRKCQSSTNFQQIVLFGNNVLMLLLGISVALNVQHFEVDLKIVNSDGVL